MSRNCRAPGPRSGRGPCRGRQARPMRWRSPRKQGRASERLDRSARHGDPAAALRVGTARRGGDVPDRADLPVGRTLRVTGKRGKTRVVPVVEAVREAIAAYVAACPYPLTGASPLFVGARGGPLNADLVRRAVRSARKRLGLPDSLTPHALRHSFATHLLARRRGFAVAAGIARPCQPVVDADLHRRSMPPSCWTSIVTPIREPEARIGGRQLWDLDATPRSLASTGARLTPISVMIGMTPDLRVFLDWWPVVPVRPNAPHIADGERDQDGVGRRADEIVDRS